MKYKELHPNPLVIIIGSLGFSLLLFIIILLVTQKFWYPPEPAQLLTQEPSQTPFPTYTNYPTLSPLATYTLFKTQEAEWIWTELPFYHVPVEIPENWSILPINHRIEYYNPGVPNSDSKECEDYLIIGPDGKQIIKITFPCTFGEGIGGECPNDIQVAMQFDTNKYLYRWPNRENNTIEYGVTTLGEFTWTTPKGYGYWCMGEYPTRFVYQVIGKKYNEIYDFLTVDRIMVSLLNE